MSRLVDATDHSRKRKSSSGPRAQIFSPHASGSNGGGVWAGGRTTNTKASSTLFVTNVDAAVDMKQVAALFEKEEGCFAFRNVRRMAFIDFHSVREATAAMRKRQGTMLPGASKPLLIDFDKDDHTKRDRQFLKQVEREVDENDNAEIVELRCSACNTFCVKLRIAVPKTFATLPRRAIDGAIAVQTNKYLVDKQLAEGEEKAIRRVAGVEMQWRLLCKVCQLPVAYTCTPFSAPIAHLFLPTDALVGELKQIRAGRVKHTSSNVSLMPSSTAENAAAASDSATANESTASSATAAATSASTEPVAGAASSDAAAQPLAPAAASGVANTAATAVPQLPSADAPASADAAAEVVPPAAPLVGIEPNPGPASDASAMAPPSLPSLAAGPASAPPLCCPHALYGCVWQTVAHGLSLQDELLAQHTASCPARALLHLRDEHARTLQQLEEKTAECVRLQETNQQLRQENESLSMRVLVKAEHCHEREAQERNAAAAAARNSMRRRSARRTTIEPQASANVPFDVPVLPVMQLDVPAAAAAAAAASPSDGGAPAHPSPAQLPPAKRVSRELNALPLWSWSARRDADSADDDAADMSNGCADEHQTAGAAAAFAAFHAAPASPAAAASSAASPSASAAASSSRRPVRNAAPFHRDHLLMAAYEEPSSVFRVISPSHVTPCLRPQFVCYAGVDLQIYIISKRLYLCFDELLEVLVRRGLFTRYPPAGNATLAASAALQWLSHYDKTLFEPSEFWPEYSHEKWGFDGFRHEIRKAGSRHYASCLALENLLHLAHLSDDDKRRMSKEQARARAALHPMFEENKRISEAEFQ